MSKLIDIAEKIKNNKLNTIEYYNRDIKLKKTYSEFYVDITKALTYIRSKVEGTGQKIGIMSTNKYEWMLVDLACLFGGYTLVAVHAKDFENKLDNVVKEFDIKLMFVEKKYMELSCGNAIKTELDSFLETISNEKESDQESFCVNEMFTVVFTSGTTGIPKAIGLKSRSIEHTIEVTSKQFNYMPDDKTIAFLPLSVFTSRLYIYGAFLLDFNVLITVPEMVLNALRIYKPTILQAVPSFFESICNVFFQQIMSSKINKCIYSLYMRWGGKLPPKISKKLKNKIYGQIVSYFGANMRVMITGTAPISVKVLEFFNAAGIPLFESYGLNETGVLTLNSPEACRIGSVGKPLDGYYIKIDENGQVLVKSDYFWSHGYLNVGDEATAKIFRDDGYAATGDIGWLDDDGFLFLKGRISDVITLTNGQKVHPSVIEKHLNNSSFIIQSMVIGSNRPYLTSIIVKNHAETDDKVIREEIKRLNRDLPVHHQVKNFTIVTEQFSLANHQLTNNLKLNRKVIYEKYKNEIQNLYD